jgi:hypothetical protein
MMKKVLLALVILFAAGRLWYALVETAKAALLPVYSHLFPICAGGD